MPDLELAIRLGCFPGMGLASLALASPLAPAMPIPRPRSLLAASSVELEGAWLFRGRMLEPGVLMRLLGMWLWLELSSAAEEEEKPYGEVILPLSLSRCVSQAWYILTLWQSLALALSRLRSISQGRA